MCICSISVPSKLTPAIVGETIGGIECSVARRGSWSYIAKDLIGGSAGRDILAYAVGIPIHSDAIGTRDGAKNPAPPAFSTFREREREGKKRRGDEHE